MISVHGDLDASNAGQLADYVQRCARHCEWLIVDLYALEFIGTAGFSALKTIIGWCSDTNVYCTVVPGVAVARLLRICDPAGVLPTAPSVADALAGKGQACLQTAGRPSGGISQNRGMESTPRQP